MLQTKTYVETSRTQGEIDISAYYDSGFEKYKATRKAIFDKLVDLDKEGKLEEALR